MKKFEDKVVVVTGAGGVLCSSFAKRFAEEGASVALLDLNKDRVEQLAAEISAAGGKAKGYQNDVLDKADLEAVHQLIKEDFGLCDILVNGAGGNHPKATTDNEFADEILTEETKSFFDLEQAGISFVFDLNYLGTLLPTQVFAQDMIQQECGNIINISSMNAYTPLTKIPAYSGAKAAVSNLTQWLAVHFSRSGIRCNALAPGFLVSAQNHSLLFDPQGNPTKRAEKILRNTPMGRFGEADELLGALEFLADDQASGFVTGVVLPVDGGFSSYAGV